MSSKRKTVEMAASDVRHQFRQVINQVMSGTDVLVTRYGDVEAVMVNPSWYDSAIRALKALEAAADQ